MDNNSRGCAPRDTSACRERGRSAGYDAVSLYRIRVFQAIFSGKVYIPPTEFFVVSGYACICTSVSVRASVGAPVIYARFVLYKLARKLAAVPLLRIREDSFIHLDRFLLSNGDYIECAINTLEIKSDKI
jgi:hypothetical protein